MEELFYKCCAFIDLEYKRLGHTLGYRFLLCPRNLLSTDTKILFLGLNPGGGEEIKEHPSTECETGSAFYNESWHNNKPGDAPLQKQVKFLFKTLRNHMNIPEIEQKLTDQEFVDKNILSAYFIPFRSPSLSTLPRKTESIDCAYYLWTLIFEQWIPSHIITLGKDVYKHIRQLLYKNGFDVKSECEIPVGWGKYTFTVGTFTKNEKIVYIGSLLHLSRYKVFGKPRYEHAIEVFINKLNLK